MLVIKDSEARSRRHGDLVCSVRLDNCVAERKWLGRRASDPLIAPFRFC